MAAQKGTSISWAIQKILAQYIRLPAEEKVVPKKEDKKSSPKAIPATQEINAKLSKQLESEKMLISFQTEAHLTQEKTLQKIAAFLVNYKDLDPGEAKNNSAEFIKNNIILPYLLKIQDLYPKEKLLGDDQKKLDTDYAKYTTDFKDKLLETLIQFKKNKQSETTLIDRLITELKLISPTPKESITPSIIKQTALTPEAKSKIQANLENM